MDVRRTALDDPPASFTEFEQQIVEQVREHGWRSTHVFNPDGGSPSFTYTTGFFMTLGEPEVIVFDFPGSLAHDVFGQTFDELRGGRRLPIAEPVTGILADESVYLVPIREAAASEHLLSSRWFYKGAKFPCLQLVWADEAGRFPWEDGFDERLLPLQPDLSEGGWENELSR